MSVGEHEDDVLSGAEQARLREIVDQLGVRTVAQRLRVADGTVLRGVAGLAMQRGSVALIRMGLASSALLAGS